MTESDKNIKIALVHCRPPEQARGFSSLPLGILYIGTVLKKRRLKFMTRYSWKIFISFIKKPSINYLARCYKDFRALGYIG